MNDIVRDPFDLGLPLRRRLAVLVFDDDALELFEPRSERQQVGFGVDAGFVHVVEQSLRGAKTSQRTGHKARKV